MVLEVFSSDETRGSQCRRFGVQCWVNDHKRCAAPFCLAVLRISGRRAACAETTPGTSSCRRSCQHLALAWGSMSITAHWWPERTAATARFRAMVVFPAPPFWEMTAMVFMMARFRGDLMACQHSCMLTCQHDYMPAG